VRLSLHENNALLANIAKRYKNAGKKEKTAILTELCHTTGYNRKYVIRLLSIWNTTVLVRIDGKLIRLKPSGKAKKAYSSRKRIYDEAFQKDLIKLWNLYDFMCGKRLVVVLRNTVDLLKPCEGLDICEEHWKKIAQVSAATIDRLVSEERKKYRLKGISYTRSGSLLKDQIPIKTFNQWANAPPGNVSGDLVGHDGGNASGDFCFTLTVTDIATAWTEMRAIKNKAQKWTEEAIDIIKKKLPMPMIGFHSDNGSEFINNHFCKYCKKYTIEFTRSRSHKKNDNCFVEQKNFDVVRKLAGYRRYDTDEELEILNKLYDSWRLMVNFFHPSVKLIKKERVGSKVKKVYDTPKTPYQQVLESTLHQSIKNRLTQHYKTLNPLALKQDIDSYSCTLLEMQKKKQINQLQEHDW